MADTLVINKVDGMLDMHLILLGRKAASYYYRFDKYYGLQDYNYYQLAINTTSLVARASASNSSKAVYNIKIWKHQSLL